MGDKTNEDIRAPTKYHWKVPGLLVNFLALLLVLAATAYVSEKMRGPEVRLGQFSVRTFLTFTTLVAFLMVLYGQKMAAPWRQMDRADAFGIRVRLDGLPWYVVIPLGFGMGCVIYVLPMICERTTSRLLGRSPGHDQD